MDVGHVVGCGLYTMSMGYQINRRVGYPRWCTDYETSIFTVSNNEMAMYTTASFPGKSFLGEGD